MQIRVWQRLDMQFFKAFGTSLQFITPPVFFDDKLWCFAPGGASSFQFHSYLH